MLHARRRWVGVMLALCCCATAVRAAAAQTSDPERAPLTLGPAALWPTLVLRGIGIDDNVFNEAENPKRDFTFTAVPHLETVLRPPRTHLSFRTGAEFVYFRDYADERHINRTVGARVEFDLTRFHPFAAATATRFRERPSAEIDLRARNRTRSYTAGVRLPFGPVVSATVAARRQTSRYDPGQEFRGSDLDLELNSETRGIDGTLAFQVTPITAVSVIVSRDEDRFELSRLRDSDSLRVSPTVTFTPLGAFSGSAFVGWRRFDAADPAIADYSGLVAGGTVGVHIVDRYHVEASFSRDVRYSYERATPTYLWLSGRGALRMDLFGGVDVRLGGGRDVIDYRARLDADGLVPRDTVVSYGGGVGYSIGQRLRLAVDGERSTRRSALPLRGYTGNRVFGSLTWRVRQP